MKGLIKKLLRESLSQPIVEDYPTNFDIKEFSKLTSFNSRIKYCQERLKRIGSGSARIVYQIDDTKVLKIAKNAKGLAQNEVEISHSQYDDLSEITANVFNYNQDNLWLEMELASKVTPAIFQQVTGFSFDDYCAAVHNYGNRDTNPSSRGYYNKKVDPEIVDLMWGDEFVRDIFSYIADYNIPVGDFQVLTSYGLVKRNGVDTIVMVDFGLDSDVCASFYCKKNLY